MRSPSCLPGRSAGGRREIVCCLAVLEDKDAAGIVEALAPRSARVRLHRDPARRRSRDRGGPAASRIRAEELAELCRERRGAEAEAIADPVAAWERARELARGLRGCRARRRFPLPSSSYGPRGPIGAPDDDGPGGHRRRGGDPGLLRHRLRFRAALPLDRVVRGRIHPHDRSRTLGAFLPCSSQSSA